MKRQTIITLTGPSCAGKSTLEKMLKERGFSPVVSTTTRFPRDGEVNGEAYYFINVDEFLKKQESNEFVESVNFNGNYYGLTTSELLQASKRGTPIVIVCEPVGQKQIAKWCKSNGWPLLSVFIDGDTRTIMERFLNRMANQVRNCPMPLVDITVGTYARRLEAMMLEEQEWRVEAALLRNYDLTVTFDRHTEDGVIAAITKLAEEKQNEELEAA